MNPPARERPVETVRGRHGLIPYAQKSSVTATAWMDTLWDPTARLLRAPASQAPHTHMVRETIWYAVGLLTRGGTSDGARAVVAIEGVLAHQFTLPGHVAHGSWRRRPDEPDPAPDAADHAHDWCFAPCFALLAITPPAGVTARLTVFSGCRHVATTVTTAPRRVATSWIGERHLIGAQDSGGSLERWDDQYCPVAVHWQTPGTPHGVHWLRAAPGTPVDAAVDEEGTLRLTHYAHRNGEPLRFVVHAPQSAPQSAPDDVTAGHWRLPGLTVRVESAAGFDAVVSRSGDLLHIAYAPHEGAAEFLLRFTPV